MRVDPWRMGPRVLYIDVNGPCALKYVENSEKRGCREVVAPRLHLSAASGPFEELLRLFCTPALAKQPAGDLQPTATCHALVLA